MKQGRIGGNDTNLEKYYNRKRREINIKVNDLVLVQTHFISAAGRRVVGKFMPKFEGPYRVLEVRNNNLIIWKKGRIITVNIDQVRVYDPRQYDTISFYSKDETLYEGKRSSNGSSRSHPGKSKSSRKTSSNESKGHKSNKGTDGLEGLGLKRKVRSLTSTNGKAVPPTYRREQVRARVQYDKTRSTTSKRHSAAEGRPVRPRQTTAVSPCPYYLRSRLQEPEGIPEEQRSTGINSLPQNSFRRKSLSMEDNRRRSRG
ncbi:uncharacterized protein TNCV_4024471 [Trichonephila clavipes]|uniref:Uncharacterized protein n=1 Tax=Trichonephila clavipes TaxID=2585209 RepID=A0A8X7BIX3_TRICX|nr:uncharacterized protein TNCV_4024471 [Trichonephila clavipes]